MMPQAPHECYTVLSPCVSQLGNNRVRFKDNLDQFGCRSFSRQKEKNSVPRSQLQNTHPAHFCHTNVHLPILSFPSVGHNLHLLFSLTVPLLKYAHSKCLLILNTLDFLQSVSQNHSHAWLLLRHFPVMRGHTPPQLRVSLCSQGPSSMGCQRLERWSPWSSRGSNILGFPHCDLNSGH